MSPSQPSTRSARIAWLDKIRAASAEESRRYSYSHDEEYGWGAFDYATRHDAIVAAIVADSECGVVWTGYPTINDVADHVLASCLANLFDADAVFDERFDECIESTDITRPDDQGLLDLAVYGPGECSRLTRRIAYELGEAALRVMRDEALVPFAFWVVTGTECVRRGDRAFDAALEDAGFGPRELPFPPQAEPTTPAIETKRGEYEG